MRRRTPAQAGLTSPAPQTPPHRLPGSSPLPQAEAGGARGVRAILPCPRVPGRRTPAGDRRPVSCLPLTNKAIWQAGGCRVPQATCEGADLKGARPGTLSRGSTAGGPTRTSLSASGPLPGHECCAVRTSGPQAPRRTLRRQQRRGQAPRVSLGPTLPGRAHLTTRPSPGLLPVVGAWAKPLYS